MSIQHTHNELRMSVPPFPNFSTQAVPVFLVSFMQRERQGQRCTLGNISRNLHARCKVHIAILKLVGGTSDNFFLHLRGYARYVEVLNKALEFVPQLTIIMYFAKNLWLTFQVSDFGLARLAMDANSHVTTRVMGTFGQAKQSILGLFHLFFNPTL